MRFSPSRVKTACTPTARSPPSPSGGLEPLAGHEAADRALGEGELRQALLEPGIPRHPKEDRPHRSHLARSPTSSGRPTSHSVPLADAGLSSAEDERPERPAGDRSTSRGACRPGDRRGWRDRAGDGPPTRPGRRRRRLPRPGRRPAVGRGGRSRRRRTLGIRPRRGRRRSRGGRLGGRAPLGPGGRPHDPREQRRDRRRGSLRRDLVRAGDGSWTSTSTGPSTSPRRSCRGCSARAGAGS